MIIIVLAVLLIITALFTIYYWADFYLRGGAQVIKEDWYMKFEKSFPIADLWMAACSLLGAVGLLTEQPYGSFFSLLATGSLIFLALMDITFNLENNLYPSWLPQVVRTRDKCVVFNSGRRPHRVFVAEISVKQEKEF